MASAPIVHLHDVNRFARLAIDYLASADLSDFREDLKSQHAVAYCLLSMAHALRRIEDENPGFLMTEISESLSWSSLIAVDAFLAQGFDRLAADALRRAVLDVVPEVASVTGSYIASQRTQR